MPESKYHAFEVTIDQPLGDDQCAEFKRLCQKADFHAISFKHHASGGKLAKAGIIYKDRRTGGNIKNGTFLKSKSLKSGGVCVKKAHRTGFIANFIHDKPVVTNLPTDFEQLHAYFPAEPTANNDMTVPIPKLDWSLITTYDDIRLCPRCTEFNIRVQDAPDHLASRYPENFAMRYPARLAPREQFCTNCKKYQWHLYRMDFNLPSAFTVPY